MAPLDHVQSYQYFDFSFFKDAFEQLLDNMLIANLTEPRSHRKNLIYTKCNFVPFASVTVLLALCLNYLMH
jgi:hypothetical protein